MGLIVGPGITKFPGAFTDLRDGLAEKRAVTANGNFLLVGDSLIDKGHTDGEVREWIREIVGRQQQSAMLSHLSKTRWAAVLSMSLDMHFEDAFQQESARHPLWPQVAVMSDLLLAPPPRTVPVYKLLGSITRDGFACSTVSFVERRSLWRHSVKGLADLTRGNPVLCLGMADCPWLLFDLIGEMLGEPTAAPSAIILLAEDPLTNNSQLHQLLKRRVKMISIKGTVGDVARSVASVAKAGYGRPLPFVEADGERFATLHAFEDIIAIVNEQLEPRITKEEVNLLQDLLFSPSITRWDPYAYGLDFERTARVRLIAEITAVLRDANSGGVAFVVRGAAVTGKTVLLKRLAWDLARAGELVLWLKPWSSLDTTKVLRDLFSAISELDPWQGKRIVVVMDDPLSFGSLTPRDVAAAARTANVSILLLTAVRSSEWNVCEEADFVGSLPIVGGGELADGLDDPEWARLAEYLVALNVMPDRQNAQKALAGVKTHSAQDTLSMLYWLLPQTRVNIASSVRDEYHRLGDIAGLAKVILGTAQGGTEILKKAYEMVAVADHYRGCLPMEVLVSALGVDYGQWVDATRDDSAAWGLLYAEEFDDGQTVWYRTRNSVVTRLIVETINGGSLVRSGELRILTELLQACHGRSSPVYREFCVRILLPQEKLEGLEFEEGLRLFDAALNALPFKDKTLLHHKGLWIKNKGRDASAARKILEQALETPVYPYVNRAEANEHIHTSLAATILDQIDQQTTSLAEGKRLILEHLSKARSNAFFDAKPVHVQANMICKLADKLSAPESPDYFALINRAISDVDHTLLILQSPAMASGHLVGDIRMLESIRDEVLVKFTNVEDLKVQAETLWNDFQSQEGFVLASRKLFAIAQAKNKRFETAYSYCQSAIIKVEEKRVAVSPALHAAAAEIYYRWRVQRQLISGTIKIDWAWLRGHLEKVLASSQYAEDPLFRYIYAITLAHLGIWPAANALFAQLRQAGVPNHVLWAPRDFLLNDTGGIRWLQGVIRSIANKTTLYVEDLQTDFHVGRGGRWPKQGEIALAAVQFFFGGATALDEV